MLLTVWPLICNDCLTTETDMEQGNSKGEQRAMGFRMPARLAREVSEMIAGEFGSVSEYVRSVVRADLERRRERRKAEMVRQG